MERKRISNIHLSLFKDIDLHGRWWRDDVWEKLLVSFSMDSQNKPFSIEELQISSNLYFDKIHKEKITEHIQNLWGSGVYIQNGGSFQLRQEIYEDYKIKIKEQIKYEKEVKEVFSEVLKKICPELGSTHFWTEFYRLCFLPMVQDIVSEIYKILFLTSRTETSNAFNIQNFFAKYEEIDVYSFFRKLFQQDNTLFSSYFFTHIKTYFCLESVRYHSSDFEIVFGALRNAKKINLFLDVYHVLDCIEYYDSKTEGEEAFFLDVLQNMATSVELEFLVSTPTIKQSLDTIQFYENYLNNYDYNLDTSRFFSILKNTNFIQNFLTEVAEKNVKITTREFFQRQRKTLSKLIDSNLIQKYETPSEALYQELEINEDFSEYRNFINKNIEDDYFSYMKHNIKLWHIVNNIKFSFKDSAEKTRYWILYSNPELAKFENYKKEKQKSQKYLCFRMTSFLFVMCFFVKDTKVLEPLIWNSFGRFLNKIIKYRKIPSGFLQTISKVGDSAFLPTSTSILVKELSNKSFKYDKLVDSPNIIQTETKPQDTTTNNIDIENQYNKVLKKVENTLHKFDKDLEEKVSLFESKTKEKQVRELEERLKKTSKETTKLILKVVFSFVFAIGIGLFLEYLLQQEMISWLLTLPLIFYSFYNIIVLAYKKLRAKDLEEQKFALLSPESSLPKQENMRGLDDTRAIPLDELLNEENITVYSQNEFLELNSVQEIQSELLFDLATIVNEYLQREYGTKNLQNDYQSWLVSRLKLRGYKLTAHNFTDSVEFMIKTSEDIPIMNCESIHLEHFDITIFSNYIVKIIQEEELITSNCIIVYCDYIDFYNFWINYLNFIELPQNITIQEVVDISELYSMESNTKIGKVLYEKDEKVFALYHIFIWEKID